MKTTLAVLILSLAMVSFIVSKPATTTTNQDQDILQKIANAHGFKHWKNVSEIKFTFNVDRDTSHFERNWAWKPKANIVTTTTKEKTISYNRNNLDSIADKANEGFINDKFWLLAPFQLQWNATNITHTLTKKVTAPISKKTMQKLTIVYGTEGGYTPGDAYDFYFGDDYIIQEWVFRKANQAEPSMITTFENYQEFNGLKIATMHKMAEGNFKLYFTNISVM